MFPQVIEAPIVTTKPQAAMNQSCRVEMLGELLYIIVIIVRNYGNYLIIRPELWELSDFSYSIYWINWTSRPHLAPGNYGTSCLPPYDNSGAVSPETFVILIICRTIIHLAPALGRARPISPHLAPNPGTIIPINKSNNSSRHHVVVTVSFSEYL